MNYTIEQQKRTYSNGVVRYGVRVYMSSGLRFFGFDQMPEHVAVMVYEALGELISVYSIPNTPNECSMKVRAQRITIGYIKNQHVYGINIVNGDGSRFYDFDGMLPSLLVKVYAELGSLLKNNGIIKEGGAL